MNIFAWIEHGLDIPWVYTSSLFAVGLLVVGGLSVRRAVANGGGVIPEEGLSIRNVFEVLVEFLEDLGETTMGDDARKYFPIVGTIFFFILVSNMMGLVPGLAGATADANVTFAWGVISFGIYNYVGIRKHGMGYFTRFMGPVLMERKIGGKVWHLRLMAPFFLILEPVLHLARILTLGVRLLANMFADHAVVMVWIGLVPIAIPAIFMGLGLLVSFLQAFVFSLLTMIYIGEALEEAH